MKERIAEVMKAYGYFYNLDDICYHMSCGTEDLSFLENMNEGDLVAHIENAANVIDLNEEDE